MFFAKAAPTHVEMQLETMRCSVPFCMTKHSANLILRVAEIAKAPTDRSVNPRARSYRSTMGDLRRIAVASRGVAPETTTLTV